MTAQDVMLESQIQKQISISGNYYNDNKRSEACLGTKPQPNDNKKEDTQIKIQITIGLKNNFLRNRLTFLVNCYKSNKPFLCKNGEYI